MRRAGDVVVVRSSALTRWPDCERRAAASLFRREVIAAGYLIREEPRNVAGPIGTSVHEAARLILDEKARSGTLPAVDVATDAAVSWIKEEIAKGVAFDERYTPNASDAHTQVAGMAKAYHTHIAPHIEPVMVETRLEADVTWSTQRMVLSGQPDVIAYEGEDASRVNKVRDLKTSVRRGDHKPQAGAYSLLGRTNGLDIQLASINYMPRVAAKKPQPEPEERPLDIVLGEQVAMNILRRIDQSLTVWREGDEERGLRPGDPAAFMSNPNSMLCTAKYCACHSAGPRGFCLDWVTDK